MIPLILTARERDTFQQTLKSLVGNTALVPPLITLLLATFFSSLGILIGVPKSEIARVILEITGVSLMLEIKMLVVVLTIVVIWTLISRDRIEIFAHYAQDRILFHFAELIRLWSSLWARLTTIVHVFAGVPTLRTIQVAKMGNPQARHVPGFSPKLE